MSDNQGHRRNTDSLIERIDQRVEDLVKVVDEMKDRHDNYQETIEKQMISMHDYLSREIIRVETQISTEREKLNKLIQTPIKFIAWSFATILLAMLSAMGVSVYQWLKHEIGVFTK